jgi:hypothetical protein
MKNIIPIVPQSIPGRECGECKVCCEGWLSGEIYGKKMYPGKNCHYICSTGCSIYDKRPKSPCVDYHCLWLRDKNVPQWMKPNECGVLLTPMQINGISFVDVIEVGEVMESVLPWLNTIINNGINLRYTKFTKNSRVYGDQNFIEKISKE